MRNVGHTAEYGPGISKGEYDRLGEQGVPTKPGIVPVLALGPDIKLACMREAMHVKLVMVQLASEVQCPPEHVATRDAIVAALSVLDIQCVCRECEPRAPVASPQPD